MVIPSCPFPSFCTAKILLCISRRSHSCCISHPSHLSCFWRRVSQFCSLGWREKEMGVVNYSSQCKNIYGKLRNREIDLVPTYLFTLNSTACPWLFWHHVTTVKWSDRFTVCVKSSTGVSFINYSKFGHTVTQFVEVLPYKPEGRGFDCRWCHWNFSLTWHCGLLVDPACNKIEYQEYFLESKKRVGLTVLETSTPWSTKGLFRTVECYLCQTVPS